MEQYSLRKGLRAGEGCLADLVRAVPTDTTASNQVRQAVRIQELFRAWNRGRGDLEALWALHAAFSEGLRAVTLF